MILKAFVFCSILWILSFPSCAKDSQRRTLATRERDTVSEMPELRDSISGSLLRSKDVILQQKTFADVMARENGSPVVDTIVGSVYVSGNEPFTRLTLALKDGRGSIYVHADTTQSKELRKLQGRVVRIIGTLTKGGTGNYIRINEFMIIE